MNINKRLIISLFLVITIFLTACNKQVANNIQNNNTLQTQIQEVCGNNNCGENEKYSNCPKDCQRAELKKLVVELSDLPSGWERQTGGIRIPSDVSEYGKKLGWKEGYEVIYRKIENPDITIADRLSVYPEGVMQSIVYKAPEDDFDEVYRYTYTEIPLKKIGDHSKAYKEKTINKESKDEYIIYIIYFSKADLFHTLEGADFELLEELAEKLTEKI